MEGEVKQKEEAKQIQPLLPPTPKEVSLDENLLSRQLAVYGKEFQGKLSQTNVFIYGMRGVGVEVAKNIILANPHVVKIYDKNICTIQDMGSNFYISEYDVKSQKTRAKACLPHLKQLNSNVHVLDYDGEINEALLSEFNVVVFTDYYNREKLIAWNKMCRAKNIGFIYAGLLGLYGFCFVDFGEDHKILDPNGEEPKQAIISSITNDKAAVVTLLETNQKKSHGFEDGDYIIFREVEGMDEMNIQEPTQVKILSKHCLEVQIDTTEFMAYTGRGLIEQVKVPIPFGFRNLEESFRVGYGLNNDKFQSVDCGKEGKQEQLHAILQGVLAYATKHNEQLPEFKNEDQVNAVQQQIDILNNLYKKTQNSLIVSNLDQNLLRQVCYFSRYQIAPLTSFWGGIIAQEIVKFTGKFTPLSQWLHIHNFDLLPEAHIRNPNVNRNMTNTRYDDYIMIFGRDFIDKILIQKVLIVGAGALGCEFTKMFSLMGIACHKKGFVHIADNDSIEISNLNRQFLFQREDIGKSKSLVASVKGKQINNSFNIKSHKLVLDASTENVFDDNFWMNLDFVVNAVDNVKAREYIDKQCVWYNKALFESGTMGVKCNSQVIVPHLTQSYTDTRDPEEESIPICTLKNSPYLIEHCIQWAIDYFEGTFVKSIKEIQEFVKNPLKYIQKNQSELMPQRSAEFQNKLEWIKKLLQIYNKPTYQECVHLAKQLFEEVHNNQIAQLLFNLPLDTKDQYGSPYWSGQKRPPQVIPYDSKDELHVEWVQSCANIFAKAFNIQICKDPKEISNISDQLKVETFIPKKLDINEIEQNQAEQVNLDESEIKCNLLIEQIKNELPKKQLELKQVEFEKDDPTNYHIEIVSAISNLRARNYKIKEVEKMKVKVIAGKIIPALATTTAMIVGTVGIEIIKFIMQKPISAMRNSFMNLALPLWVFCDPVEPFKNNDTEYDLEYLGPVKAIPKGFTKWDFIFINGPMRVSEFRDYFLEHYDVIINKIYYENKFLFDQSEQEAQQHEQMDIQDLFELVFEDKIPEFKQYLKFGIYASDRKGNECKMPFVKYSYKGETIKTESDLLSESASEALDQAEESMKPKSNLSPSKQKRLEQYLEDQVREFLNQLIIDALKERPHSFLKFSYEWLQLYKANQLYIPQQFHQDSDLSPSELELQMKEYLRDHVDIYIEELVFNLITKRPPQPLDFAIKWFFQKHKDDRLHIIKEQQEVPGEEPIVVEFKTTYVEEFESYNQEYEESRLKLLELENKQEEEEKQKQKKSDKTLENHQIELAQHYEQYGLICMKFHKTQEAITYLKKSLFTIIKFEDKANSMEASRINFNLAELFDRQQQYFEAFRFYKEALWLQEQILGEDRIESVEILQRIGLILQKHKKYNSALQNFQKSYNIMKNNFNYECPQVINPLINLANCLLNLRKFDDALTYYKKVLRMYERNNQMEETVENVSFLYNMSIAAENCRFFPDAINLMNEALDMIQICSPKNNSIINKINDRIRQLHQLYDSFSK
ncbi:hypothetical protein ABPG74_018117 [Tetrahymena malaccensis]